MSSMPNDDSRQDAARALAEAEAMLGRLPSYLQADALFEAVTVDDGGTRHATLTLGNLLERLDVVRRAAFDDPELARRAAAADARHDALRAAHREAYAAKLSRELRSHESALRAEREDGDDEGGAAPGHRSASRRHEAAIRRLRDAGRD